MTARDEYELNRSLMPPGYGRDTLVRLADAALAEADEKLAKLKDEKCLAVMNERDFRVEIEEKLARAEAEIAYLREREKLLGDTGMHQQKRADKAEQRVRELEAVALWCYDYIECDVERPTFDEWLAARLPAPELKEEVS